MLRYNSKYHALANKLTPIRVRLEKFLLDHSNGCFKNKNDFEKLKEAKKLIAVTIVRIDEIFEGI
jgi:hypothetical protein